VYFTRDMPRRWSSWHPHAYGTPVAHGFKQGAALRLGLTPLISVELGQPAGPVVQPGTDHPYTGMDPSDPSTYTRPYRPARGMIGWLNYDGAMPNKTQTVANPGRSWDQQHGRRPG